MITEVAGVLHQRPRPTCPLKFEASMAWAGVMPPSVLRGVIPDLTPQQEAVLDGPEPGDVAGPLDAGAEDDSALEEQIEQDVVAAETQNLLSQLPEIGLRRDRVPPDLDPGRFFEVMCLRVLDNSPINFHREARRRRLNPQEPKELSEDQ